MTCWPTVSSAGHRLRTLLRLSLWIIFVTYLFDLMTRCIPTFMSHFRMKNINLRWTWLHFLHPTQPNPQHLVYILNPHVHRMKSRRDKNTFNKINVISSTLMIFVTVLVDNYADVGQRYSSCCHFLPSVFLAHKPKFHPLQTPGNILNKHFASHFSV